MKINVLDLGAPAFKIETPTEGLLFDLATCDMYTVRKYGFNCCYYPTSGKSVEEMLARLNLLESHSELFHSKLLGSLLEDLRLRFLSAVGSDVTISSLDEHLLIKLAYRLEYAELDGEFRHRNYITNRQEAVVEELGMLEDWLSTFPVFIPAAVEVVCALRARFLKFIS